MTARALYRILRKQEHLLCIADQCLPGMPSITNDVESVVRELQGEGLLGVRKLLYLDSKGAWNQIVHDGAGRFLDFAFGGRTMKEAIAMLRARGEIP